MITVRVVTWGNGWIVIERDGQRIADETKIKGARLDDSHMKAAEIVLTALGYKPDLYRMYMDDALLVLNFYGPDEELPAQGPENAHS